MADAPAHAPVDTKTALDWGSKLKFRRQFTRQAIRSYVFLSFGMGVIALLLPIVLPLVGGYDDHFSISYFYYVSDLSRNILVGGLWATGAFLFLFHGLSKLENWILNVAGLAVISVAMNPMPKDQGNKELTIHAASAVVFFLCLAVVAVRLSKGRLDKIIYPPIKRRFKIAYDAAGAAMLAMPAAVIALHFLGRQAELSHWIYWVEALGIWSFSFYWFVKTQEYRLLLGIR
jgi:hypothetical protein